MVNELLYKTIRIYELLVGLAGLEPVASASPVAASS